MAWRDFLYKRERKESQSKENELEIICDNCGEKITGEKMEYSPKTKNFYHGDFCVLSYCGKPVEEDKKESYCDTFQISRAQALEELRARNKN